MIFTKHVTLFLVSTFGILSVADGGATRTKRGLKSSKSSGHHHTSRPNLIDRKPGEFLRDESNPCAESNPDTDDEKCFVDGIVNTIVGPQAGINITKGYEGTYTEFTNFDGTKVEPITISYLEQGLCPVNVHWHSGAEHFSAGEYDCTSKECAPNNRPTGGRQLSKYGLLKDEDVNADETHRVLDNTDDDGPPRDGFRCNYYDKNDPRFTRKFDFQYCKNMTVGETYEVHWPHGSATGGFVESPFAQCGTPNQYQTPFYRGLFCNFPKLDLTFPDVVCNGFSYQQVARNFAVQGQVFTIIDDEDYYYPDLFRGMITGFGDYGTDMAVYIGSSTGSDRNNTKCSMYSPVTWQMDRKCHLISASSFDKLCADMLSQHPADMTNDTSPDGARELVADELADPRVGNIFNTRT